MGELIKWKREFPGWDVPDLVTEFCESGVLVDESWHNDAMPVFHTPSESLESPRYAMWVDDRDQTEWGLEDWHGKYLVYWMPNGADQKNNEPRYIGDDLHLALRAMGLSPTGTVLTEGGEQVARGRMKLADVLQLAREKGVIMPGKETDWQMAEAMGIPPTEKHGVSPVHDRAPSEPEPENAVRLLREAAHFLSDLLIELTLVDSDARRAEEWLERYHKWKDRR